MSGIKRPGGRALLVLAAAAALLLLFPAVVRSNYIISVGVTCFLFAGFGVSWNMISGYGGQISWCHAAFVAIGAYTAVLMESGWGVTPLAAIPVSMVIALAISTLIGRVSFRYRGPFFSITTIAFAEILRVLLLHFKDFTGGSAGITITYTGLNPLKLMFPNDTPFYYIMLGVLAVVIFIAHRFERSKTGYYLKSVKGDEDAAISLGINTGKIKLTAFQLSAVLTAAIGVFYAAFIGYIQPNGVCGMDLSVKIGSVVIVGGIGTVWGAVLGAFILIPLIELANVVLGAQGGAQLLYGLALIVVVIVQPNGILALLKKIPGRRSSHEEAAISRKKEGEG